MKRYIHDDIDIFAMSNIRGKQVVVPHNLPFSFYFSEKNSSHGIRVKPLFNPDRIHINKAGNLELHGDWKYTPGEDDKHVSLKQFNQMIEFFKTYKVLFAAVWEGIIQEDVVQDYFKGNLTFEAMLEEFDFYLDYDMHNIHDIASLEKFVRDNEIFNMND